MQIEILNNELERKGMSVVIIKKEHIDCLNILCKELQLNDKSTLIEMLLYEKISNMNNIAYCDIKEELRRKFEIYETIGMDTSIEECIKSGYLMMDYPKHKIFTKTTYYRFYKTFPDYTEKENELVFEAYHSFDYLVDLYIANRESMNYYYDLSSIVNKKTRDVTWDDVLILADAIDSYCGLS